MKELVVLISKCIWKSSVRTMSLAKYVWLPVMLKLSVMLPTEFSILVDILSIP